MSSERKSILCPNCRKLISVDEPECPYCGLKRPGLHNTAGALRKIFSEQILSWQLFTLISPIMFYPYF